MSRLLFYILFFTGVGVFFYTYQPPTLCDTGVKYKIGSIDNRFDIDKQELLTDIQEATSLWSNSYGKNLFTYAPDDEKSLTVNMVYDERQEFRNEINDKKQQVSQEESALQSDLDRFEARSGSFKKKLAEFNARVEDSNSQGGATKEEFEKLQEEQGDLQAEAQALNAEARRLNQSVDEFNVDVGVLNSSVSNFNTVLVGKPEQGLFDPQEGTITIYFQNSKKELVHTLAHEFGHSLGMDHVLDKLAVMYARTNELTEPSSADAIELQKACQKHTLYENLFTKANYYIKLYQ